MNMQAHTNVQQEILETLQRTEAYLATIATALSQQKSLGFVEPPRSRTIYVNRRHGGLWYMLDEQREPINIPQTGIECFVRSLEFEQEERRNKPTWKMKLGVDAGTPFVLEAGIETAFCRCMLAALAAIPVAHLRQPVIISVSPGKIDEVVIGALFTSTGRVMAERWDKDTDFRPIAKMAVDNIRFANSPNDVDF